MRFWDTDSGPYAAITSLNQTYLGGDARGDSANLLPSDNAGKSSTARSLPSSPIFTMPKESEGDDSSFGERRGRRCWKGTVLTLTGRGATRTMLFDIISAYEAWIRGRSRIQTQTQSKPLSKRHASHDTTAAPPPPARIYPMIALFPCLVFGLLCLLPTFMIRKFAIGK